MDRRKFIRLSSAGLAGLALSGELSLLDACIKDPGRYSIVILGDTHFDAEPTSVYHSLYVEPNERRYKVHYAEFLRNGEMWRERCPKLLDRAASLVSRDTKMVFQMGDLIQGDCGSGEMHTKMLDDAVNTVKGAFGDIPFVTVVGNHDIRGVDAEKAYKEYMPARMSKELGKEIAKTTFGFNIGDDAFIFIDFNKPDNDEIEKLLKETEGARHTFVVSHGPVFPYDGGDSRWFFHGYRKHTDERRHFRAEFAKRNAIALCGHIHTTEFYDWFGDGGRITQMTMNSVWSKDELGKYDIVSEGPGSYGSIRQKLADAGGKEFPADDVELFNEYKPGLRAYSLSRAAGSYKLNVSRKHVTIEFHAGDSREISHIFVLR